MSEKQFHKEFSEGDELPISIPSTDYAWNDMRGKLDVGMPEGEGTGTNISSRKPGFKLWKWFTGGIVVSFFVWFAATQLPAGNKADIAKTVNSDSNTPDSQQPGQGRDIDSGTETATDSAALNTGDKTNSGEPVITRSTEADNTKNNTPSSGENKTGATGKNKKVDTENISRTVSSANGGSTSTTGKNTPLANNKIGNSKTGSDRAAGNRTGGNNSGSNRSGSNKTGTVKAGKSKLDNNNSSSGGKNNPLRNGTAKTSTGKLPDEKNAAETTSPVVSTEDKIHSSVVLPDNSTAAKVNRHLPASLPMDSAGASPVAAAQKSPVRPRLNIQVGLQWNFQAPFRGGDSYFYGPKGQREPLRSLYPGAWLSYQHNKSLYAVEISPFFTTTVPVKPLSIESSSYSNNDTTFITTKTKTLRKLFGMSAAFSYTQNITGNWWAGGSLRGNWWQKGVAVEGTELIRRSDSGRFNDIKTNSASTYLLSDTAWSSISKMQFVVSGDIFYRRKLWQAGLEIGLPINSLTQRNGPRNPLYVAIIFRLAVPSISRKK